MHTASWRLQDAKSQFSKVVDAACMVSHSMSLAVVVMRYIIELGKNEWDLLKSKFSTSTKGGKVKRMTSMEYNDWQHEYKGVESC